MRWRYIVHVLSDSLKNVYLVELRNNEMHRARKIGVNSYAVEIDSAVQFYSWQVGGLQERLDTLGPGCDWMSPSIIARVTENGVYNVSNYFNACAAGKRYKAILPRWGWGDRVQAIVSTLTLASLHNGRELTLYWTPPANMRSTRHLHDQNVFNYFYIDDPRVTITSDIRSYSDIPAVELTSEHGFQNMFSKEIASKTGRSETLVAEVYCKTAYGLVRPSKLMVQYLDDLPEFEFALHIRRANKIRDIGNRDFEVIPRDLGVLNRKTKLVLRRQLNESSRVFVCGDSEDQTHMYTNLLSTRVVAPSPIEGVIKKMFFDFFAMGRARHIITSQRYSSFSMTSALIHGRFNTVVFARNQLRRARPCIFGACLRYVRAGIWT